MNVVEIDNLLGKELKEINDYIRGSSLYVPTTVANKVQHVVTLISKDVAEDDLRLLLALMGSTLREPTRESHCTNLAYGGSA